jgi:hypothetical protein
MMQEHHSLEPIFLKRTATEMVILGTAAVAIPKKLQVLSAAARSQERPDTQAPND